MIKNELFINCSQRLTADRADKVTRKGFYIEFYADYLLIKIVRVTMFQMFLNVEPHSMISSLRQCNDFPIVQWMFIKVDDCVVGVFESTVDQIDLVSLYKMLVS